MSTKPTQTKAWKSLESLSYEDINLNLLFDQNPKRFDEFSFETNGLFIDFSKQKITSEIKDTLCQLAKEMNVAEKRDAMFAGEKINRTEGRAVLHTALRRPQDEKVIINGHNVILDIHNALGQMKKLADKVRGGDYKGFTDKAITDVVSIGIGGSDLGPRLVYDTLKSDQEPINLHFVANIDGDDLQAALNQCHPETTLFIVISKSFGTQETLTNALSARQWMRNHFGDDKDISDHFIAVSANVDKALAFGIKEENIYPMWDWVNGRFSLWSAVGLSFALGLGFDKFHDLLSGAHQMDQHFSSMPFDQNIPVLMALVGIWNTNFGNSDVLAVLPYAEKLKLLPAYLQQLEMESNGKRVDNEGALIKDYDTCPTLFGEAGTKGQHSFYQLLHQGTADIPCDFIGVINPDTKYKNHHESLIAHMLAQGQAMMQGKLSPDNLAKDFVGNKPSTTILLDKLDAYHLGMLIALYEHKTAVQGFIWNVNSFDQFGVELGKEMARNIEENGMSNTDPSTSRLYSRIHKAEK